MPAERSDASGSKEAAKHTSKRPLFDKILIANRGEIACRVIRTAKRLGIKTVAVFSEPDANSLHVKLADEAVLLGPAASAESYLRIDKIIAACQLTGAQAVHPGYGFLSENAGFADALAQNGITFIGPPASAIVSMGSKSESKKIMEAAGVPCTPGYHGSNQDQSFLLGECEKIGWPVLIKAVKGGGGKGMKLAERADEFADALESAQREAEKSFGDGTVLIEKYIPISRHVEVQIMADQLGNAVYLFERDCSVQRRHQKIIEEAPAPGLSEELRRKLGETAVAAARAVNYVGAGTVEFLVDNRDFSFFFMEMNTRLQVEHPISEMISGQDFVEWQIEAAAGNPLPKRQEELVRTGWAFEARIYAEKPRNNFLPDGGHLQHVRTPVESSSLRLETGFEQGDDVSGFYDPMISKLVVHGSDRADALRRLRKALDEYEVVGPSTNIEFLSLLASHPSFQAGDVHTAFIGQHHDALFPPVPTPSCEQLAHAALALTTVDRPLPVSPFTSLAYARFGFGSDVPSTPIIFTDGSSVNVSPRRLVVSTSDRQEVFSDAQLSPAAGGRQAAVLGNERSVASFVSNGDRLHVFTGNAQQVAHLELAQPTWLTEVLGKKESAANSVKAPMPCTCVAVNCAVGDKVSAGQVLVVVEAMKSELSMRAPADGVVAKVNCRVGSLVPEGKELVEFIPE